MLRTYKQTGRAEVKTVQYFVSGEWQWIRCCDLLDCRRFRKLPKSSNYSSSAMQKSEARPSPAEFHSSVSTDWTKAIYSWTLCLSVRLSLSGFSLSSFSYHFRPAARRNYVHCHEQNRHCTQCVPWVVVGRAVYSACFVHDTLIVSLLYPKLQPHYNVLPVCQIWWPFIFYPFSYLTVWKTYIPRDRQTDRQTALIAITSLRSETFERW